MMRARDLARDYPSVTLSSDALAAAQTLARGRLPVLLVTEDDGRPHSVLPAAGLISALVPSYVVEDPALSAVIDERHADVLGRALAGRPVRDCLPAGRPTLPVADADDTVVEVAALMARWHSPLVAVVERHGRVTRTLGVITATDLLDRLLEPR